MKHSNGWVMCMIEIMIFFPLWCVNSLFYQLNTCLLGTHFMSDTLLSIPGTEYLSSYELFLRWLPLWFSQAYCFWSFHSTISHSPIFFFPLQFETLFKNGSSLVPTYMNSAHWWLSTALSIQSLALLAGHLLQSYFLGCLLKLGLNHLARLNDQQAPEIPLSLPP